MVGQSQRPGRLASTHHSTKPGKQAGDQGSQTTDQTLTRANEACSVLCRPVSNCWARPNALHLAQTRGSALPRSPPPDPGAVGSGSSEPGLVFSCRVGTGPRQVLESRYPRHMQCGGVMRCSRAKGYLECCGVGGGCQGEVMTAGTWLSGKGAPASGGL